MTQEGGVTRDVLLAEFKALRDEMLAIRQIQTAVYTAALTILAAVGSVALAKKGGRVEILLVLPYVLSGLGLVTVQCTTGVSNIGDYVRKDLWPELLKYAERSEPSWEIFAKRRRPWFVLIPTGLVPLLILVVPSIASIVITRDQIHTDLWPLWWGAVAAVVLSVLASIALPLGSKLKAGGHQP